MRHNCARFAYRCCRHGATTAKLKLTNPRPTTINTAPNPFICPWTGLVCSGRGRRPRRAAATSVSPRAALKRAMNAAAAPHISDDGPHDTGRIRALHSRLQRRGRFCGGALMQRWSFERRRCMRRLGAAARRHRCVCGGGAALQALLRRADSRMIVGFCLRMLGYHHNHRYHDHHDCQDLFDLF
jgi:hypothetical protein